jgi:alpha-tubulin suppressor-like RCC1 family protein
VQEIGGNLAGKKVISIAAGKYRTAAVTDDGDVYVWEGRADFFPAEGRAAGSGSKKSRGQGIKGQWNGDHVLGSSAGSSSSSYERGGSYRSESPSLMERMHQFRLSKMGSSPSPRISSSIIADYQVLEGRFDAICPVKVKGPKKVADVAVGEKHSLALQSWFKDTTENGSHYSGYVL